MEIKLSDLTPSQRLWVDRLVSAAIRRGIEVDDARRLGAHYAAILRSESIDPDSKAWLQVEEAVDDYLDGGLEVITETESPQPTLALRSEVEPVSVWSYLAHSGALLMAAPVVVLLQEALSGTLSWQLPASWKLVVNALFVTELIVAYVATSWLYHRRGWAWAAGAIAIAAAIGVAIVFLPEHLWGRAAIEAAPGSIPTAVVSGVVVAAGWSLQRFADLQHRRFLRAHSAAILSARHSGDVSKSNDLWFEDLSQCLRQEHHYSLRLTKRETGDLRAHLAQLTQQRGQAVLAQEEFGPAKKFALQLISNSRSAQLRKTWIDLVGAGFVVVLGVVVIVANIGELFSGHGWFLRTLVIVCFLAWVLVIFVWATTLAADLRRLTRGRD